MFRRVLFAVCVCVGCGDDSSTSDAGPVVWQDAEADDVPTLDAPLPDVLASDAGPGDAGNDAPIADAGVDDAGADAGDDAAAPDAGGSACADLSVDGPGTAIATGTTVGAGNDFESALCEGTGPEVTVLFTAPTTASYIFDTFGTDFDAVLSIFTTDCTERKELFCADDTDAELDATLSVFLNAGESVLVNLDGLDADEEGVYVLNATQIDDSCPDVDLGSAVGSPVRAGEVLNVGSGDNRSASCGYGGGGVDRSFAWTAPEAGTYTIAVANNTTIDTVLYVLDGDCSGEEMACNDDSVVPTERSTVTTSFEAGQRVIIVVDAFTAGDFGTFDLNITGPE